MHEITQNHGSEKVYLIFIFQNISRAKTPYVVSKNAPPMKETV
jgi:hypothetical protein